MKNINWYFRLTKTLAFLGTALVLGNCAWAQDACGIWYVTPNGNGNGSKNSPTSLQTVITHFTNNNVQAPNNRVRMAVGNYPIDAPIFIPNNIVLEGGYDPTTWHKLSNGITKISRSAANPEYNPTRLVGLYCQNVSGFKLRDLNIDVADGDPLIPGLTVYGVYVNACSNYEITRCVIKSGKGTDGKESIPGQIGANGANGGGGGKGCRRCDSAPGGYNHLGGDGGDSWSNGVVAGGKGGNGGTRGAGGMINNPFNLNQCPLADPAIPAQDGGNGSAIFPIQPGQGGVAPVGYDFYLKYGCEISLDELADIGGILGSTINDCLSNNPQFFGNNGLEGMDAPENADNNGLSQPPAYNGGFFIPGDGTDGLPGKSGGGGGGGGGGGAIANAPMLDVLSLGVITVLENLGSPGGGGGGGGEGGQGGGGGTGGGGGGGSFAIFIWDSGTGGKVKDCTLSTGLPGKGKLGAMGGAGGEGGLGGPGGFDCNDLDSGCAAGCEGGRGGNGGKGGKGQSGGKGGDGADGIALPFYQNFNGTPVEPLNVNCAGCEPKIKVISNGCSNSDVTYIVQNADPDTEYKWTFGEGANPPTATGDTVITRYANQSNKNIILTIAQYPYRYSDFVDIFMQGPEPNIELTAGMNVICANQTVTFTSNTPATNYQWTVTPSTTHTDSTQSTYTITAPANISDTLTYTVGLRIKTDCCGWSEVETTVVKVVPAISPQINAMALSGIDICPGEPVTFKAAYINAGTNPALSWFKNNGTPLNSTADVITLTDLADNDQVYVEMVSGYPCLTQPNPFYSNKITVNVFDPPQINCPAPITVRLGNPVNLSATLAQSGAAPYKYVWVLGNGQSTDTVYNASANELTRTVTYGGPGTYTATIYVTDANGCKGSCQTTVEVQPLTTPISVDFSATPQPLEGCESLTVTFTATGNAAQYDWNFGDGTTGQGQTVTHTFTASNSFYTVQLIGKDLNSSDTAIKVNYVKVYKPAEALVSLAGQKRCVNQPILFGNSGKDAYFFDWNFGDGSTNSTLAAPYHTYAQPGTYTVGLKVWNINADGNPVCPDETSITLEISDRPQPKFEQDVNKGCEPVVVKFTNLSVPYSGAFAITKTEWDFGDGGTATFDSEMPVLSYTYARPGTYNVRLTVTNAAGCDSTIFIQDAVEVLPAPVAKIQANGQEIASGDTLVIEDRDGVSKTVTFRHVGRSDFTGYDWNFSDVAPAFSGERPPSITYPKEGIYPVTLILHLGECHDEETIYVEMRKTDQLGIPNVFSPNGDNFNDFFSLFAPNFTYDIQIYSRWGDKVFSGNQLNEWNGKYNNTGNDCPEGVYMYYVKAVSLTKKGVSLERSGTVTIIR